MAVKKGNNQFIHINSYINEHNVCRSNKSAYHTRVLCNLIEWILSYICTIQLKWLEAVFIFFLFFLIFLIDSQNERKFILVSICFVYPNGKSICMRFVCTTNMFIKLRFSIDCLSQRRPPHRISSYNNKLFLSSKTTCKNEVMLLLCCTLITLYYTEALMLERNTVWRFFFLLIYHDQIVIQFN